MGFGVYGPRYEATNRGRELPEMPIIRKIDSEGMMNRRSPLQIGLVVAGLVAASAANAQHHHYRGHHGGGHGDAAAAAIIGGIVGLGLGAAIASANQPTPYYAPPPVYYPYSGYNVPPPAVYYGYGARPY